MWIKRIRGVLLLAAAAAVAFSAVPIRAAEDPATGINLTTSPLPINLVTQPGKTLTTTLRVKNSGTATTTLRVDLLKFKAFGEEGKPHLLDREPGDDYFDWVSFSPSTFVAEPNVWKTVTMTIKVPPSAAFGYYYAVVFEPASKPKVSGRNQGVVGAAATLVLVEARVPGAKRAIDVVEFSADRRVYEFMPATFSVRLKNSGNVHVAPYGNIFINRGGTSKSISMMGVNQEKGNVLPDSNRVFTSSWTDAFPVYQTTDKTGKDGKPARVLKWDLTQVPKLRIGRYTANLLLAYDDGVRDVPVEAAVSFWVIPWRLILGALVITLLVLVGLQSSLRNVWRRFGKGRKR